MIHGFSLNFYLMLGYYGTVFETSEILKVVLLLKDYSKHLKTFP